MAASLPYPPLGIYYTTYPEKKKYLFVLFTRKTGKENQLFPNSCC